MKLGKLLTDPVHSLCVLVELAGRAGTNRRPWIDWYNRRSLMRELLLMAEIRLTSWYGKYHIIYRVLYIPGGAGVLPSPVWLTDDTTKWTSKDHNPKVFPTGNHLAKASSIILSVFELISLYQAPFMIFGLVLVLGTGHCFEECRWRTGNCQSYADQLLRLLGWFILPQRWTRDWMHWTLRWQKHFSWKLTHFTTDSCHPRQILRGA